MYPVEAVDLIGLAEHELSDFVDTEFPLIGQGYLIPILKLEPF